MIQRKQSLYLLAAILLLTFTLLTPFVKTDILTFDAFKIIYTGADSHLKIATYPIGIYLIITILVHLITIFLFKNRKLQMRFTIFSILLSVGFYGLLIFYHFMSQNEVGLTFSQYNYGLIAPLLAAIFDILAFGGIKKDELLVKMSERLR